MGKYDGKVVISTALDNSDIGKDVREISGEFGGLNETVKETEKAIDRAFAKTDKQKVQLTGFQYDSAEIQKFVDEAVAGLNDVSKHSNGMRAAFEEAQKKVTELGEQGFWWGDEDYEKAYAALERIKNDIQEAKYFATTQPEEKNPFGVDTLSGKIQEAKNRLEALVEAGKGLGTQEYDDAYVALSKLTQEAKAYQKSLTETVVPPALDTYEGKILSLENALKNLRDEGRGLGDPAYDEIYRKLALAKNEAKKYADELTKVPGQTKRAASETNKLAKSVNSFASRLKSIFLGAFFFNGISAGLRELTDFFGKTLKTSNSFTSELSKLKGALLTAFQPIYTAIAPAVTKLMNLLTRGTLVVAEFFATLTGTSVRTNAAAAKELYEEADAFNKVEKSAKKAGKTVAGFDEINTLSSASADSGSTNDSTVVTPVFPTDISALSGVSAAAEKVRETMEAILVLVGLTGAGILAWKIIDAYTAGVSLVGVLKSVKAALVNIGSIALIVAGAILLIKGYCDSWVNGVDWKNLLTTLGGIGLILTGVTLKFGSLGLSIGLVTAGVALLVLGIKDFIENGPSLQNTILIIGGAVAVAVGLATAGVSVLVSAIIGAVAAVAAFTAAILLEEPAIMSVEEAQKKLTEAKEAAAAAENDYINAVDGAESALNRLKDAEEAAGITGAELYKQVQGGTLDYADMTAAQKEVYKAYLDNEKKQQDLKTATEEFNAAKKAETLASFENQLALAKESGSYDEFKRSVVAAFEAGELSAEEARELMGKSMSEMSTDSQKTFMEDIPGDIKEGLDPNKYETTRKKICDWFRDAGKAISDWFTDYFWKGITDWWNSKVKPIFTKKFWEDKFNTLKEGAKAAFNGVMSVVERAVNAIIRKINTLSWDIPDWVPFIGGGTFGFNFSPISIPRLAQGAVIPPNREFMAVLGDQKHGTNIEAPLETIKLALAEVMASQGAGTGDVNITFAGDLAQLARVLKPVIDRENKRVGASLIRKGAQ